MITPRTDAELAAALYGAAPAAAAAAAPASSPAPSLPASRAEQPAERPTARSESDLASALYSKPQPPSEKLPPQIAALRDGDLARRMYDDETAHGANLDALFADVDGDPDIIAAERRAWAGVFNDVGLAPADARDIAATALRDAHPTPELLGQWEAEATRQLHERFGDADAALADARLLLRRDPRLQRVLNQTGLGSHPRVVLEAVLAARRQIAAGKLNRT